jgi:choloylglycine hydrolase
MFSTQPVRWLIGTAVVATAVFGAAGQGSVRACTRCVYLGPNDTVVVARSMDWAEDPGTNLYCFPRGLKRNGAAGPRSITWTSRFGSAVCAFYEAGTVDGMNDQGLVANTLYLVESDYGKPREGQPLLTITAWAQFVLDNFATVKQAVEALRKEPFAIVAPVLPNGKEPVKNNFGIW